MKDTSVIIISIFLYVAFAALIWYFLFKFSLEGFNYFPLAHQSFYTMLTLLTTANFPDVMLPAYYESRINCLFFIGYLVFGLYFLQNILLAVVFDNYKRQLVEKVDDHTETRVKYISEYFDSFDRDKKGVLSLAKGKLFFA